MGKPPIVERLPEQPLRNWRGQFAKRVCVNAHDRCFGGANGKCPYCEVQP